MDFNYPGLLLSRNNKTKTLFSRSPKCMPSLLLVNARSILKKFDELCVLQSTYHPGIIAVTESWLNPHIDSTLLHLRSYVLFRDDRRGRIGGGVCNWVHESLRPQRIDIPKHDKFECLAIYLTVPGVLLLSLYLPPNISAADNVTISTLIVDTVDTFLINFPETHIAFCGDFNNFNTNHLEVSFHLINKVTAPTRGNNVLDKIFTSSGIADSYDDCDVLPPLSTSDHNCVLLKGTMPSVGIKYCTVWDFRKSNIDKYMDVLTRTDFNDVYLADTVDKKLCIFYEKLKCCCAVIPTTTVTMSTNDKPWMTPLLKSLINRRWFAFRTRDFGLYNHLKTKVKQEIVKAKLKWASKCTKSSKDAWTVVNETRGTNIKPSLCNIVSQFSSEYECCNYLNHEFQSMFTEDSYPYSSTASTCSSNNTEHWCPLIHMTSISCFCRFVRKSQLAVTEFHHDFFGQGHYYLLILCVTFTIRVLSIVLCPPSGNMDF